MSVEVSKLAVGVTFSGAVLTGYGMYSGEISALVVGVTVLILGALATIGGHGT